LTAKSHVQHYAPDALLVASGFAGLGYQIIWTEQARVWLGHEAPAVLAVVAAFFGGLGLGGVALARRVERSAEPVRFYAGAELVLAGYASLLPFLWPLFGVWMERVMGVEPSALKQWSTAFLGTFVFLLPATAAMGVTLPALERLLRELEQEGRSIAGLYARNTLGALLGVLVVAFWSLPALGLTRSTLLCVALNFAAGVSALGIFPRPRTNTSRVAARHRARGRELLVLLALTGFLGIGYEVVVVRVLGQVTEDTVYTFALLLATYLAGTTLGAAIYRRWLEKRVDRWVATESLFAGLTLACLLGACSLWGAERLRLAVNEAFGTSMAAALASETVLAFAAFALPTTAMGVVWTHLSERATEAGIELGRALGVNTLAAALAPAVFGAFVVPTFGSKLALLAILTGYLAPFVRNGWFLRTTWAPAAGIALLAVFTSPLAFIDVPAGAHVVSHDEGTLAAVSVVEDTDGVRRLRINNREQEGSSTSFYVDARQAWLPLLLHPAPRRALFLGLGTGVTASAATLDSALEVDAVELLPEVIRARTHFVQDPTPQADARLHIVPADARRYVRTSDRRYDVIISDNFHPARSGSGALYTVEHFEAVRERLAPDGVFCQWLPVHQLDLDTLRSIARSFLVAYPHASALIANNSLETPVFGLLGRRDDARFDDARLALRRQHALANAGLASLALADELAVFGSFVAGSRSLEHFAAGAPLNTDDRPIVAYRAPHVTYAPSSTPGERLVTLLGELGVAPEEILSPHADGSFRARLSAYWNARDRFIAVGRDVRPSPNLEDMLAQVREPLLAVLRLSPDFRPAYDPLLAMGRALSRSDSTRARALLTELARLQPARTEASELLRRIGNETETTSVTSR
jgi:spermidine synthase